MTLLGMAHQGVSKGCHYIESRLYVNLCTYIIKIQYYLIKVEEIHIRPMEFYKNLNVEVLLNTNVISIDFEKKIITLDTDPEKPR